MKRGIFRQLLIPMILIVSVLTVTILSVIAFSFSRTYENQIQKTNSDMTKLISAEISVFLSEAYSLTEELSVNPGILTMNTKSQSDILSSCVGRNEYLELIYVQGTDGIQTGRSSGKLADRSTRWWFKQMMEVKKPFVSKTYYSVSTMMPCASVFFPMYKNGDLTGIIGTDIKLNYLVNLANEFSDLKEDKVSFIIDGEGAVVAHPDTRYIQELYNYKKMTKTVSKKNESGTVLTDNNGNVLTEDHEITVSESFGKIISDVMSGQNGFSTISNDGTSYYVSYNPIKLNGSSDSWSVITMQKKTTAMRLMYLMLLIAGIISLIVLAGAIFVIAAVAKKITKPVLELTELVGNASEGDFTIKADVADGTELSTLADSFNKMTDKISHMLSGIMSFIGGVSSSTENLQNISKQSGSIVEEVEKIAAGTHTQRKETHDVVELAGEMANRYTELQKRSRQMADAASGISRLSKEETGKVSELKKQSLISLQDIEKSNEKIRHLDEFSNQIGTILSQITEISDQTSLLALNASIEAARAGEQGKGFAVVAEEIGKLASHSADSTKNISTIMRDLKNEVTSTVSVMELIKQTFKNQIDSVDNVQAAFSRFNDAAVQTMDSMQYVNKLVEEMETFNNSVTTAIHNIYTISNDTASVTANVVEVITAQKEEIALVTEKVSGISKASELLENEMKKFKLA